jgi:Ca-activated chloride channel homolog
MPPFELAEPALLILALLAFPTYRASRARGGRLRFSSLSLLPRHARSWRQRLLFLPPTLLACAVASLALAAAGPRRGDQTSRVERKGIAIMMVLDTSSSMRALDLSEGDEERTRLDVVKEVFSDFIAGRGALGGRADDAIGLVTFAGYADCRCPLTLDHQNLRLIAEDVEIVRLRAEDGTAIGDGLGLALERLKESKASSRVVLLLTDGVNNSGATSPGQAAQVAQALGIKVYTIGAGRKGLAPIRTTNPFTGEEVLRRVPVNIDEETLTEIAERTSGRYFRATDRAALQEIYQAIDRLERTDISEIRFLRYTEYASACVALAMALAGLAWLLSASVLRRLP